MENYNHTLDDEEVKQLLCKVKILPIAFMAFAIGLAIGISIWLYQMIYPDAVMKLAKSVKTAQDLYSTQTTY